MRVKIMLTMLLAMVSLVVGSTAHAAPRQQTAAIISADIQQQMKNSRAVAAYYDEKTRVFDVSGARAAGLDPQIVTDFQTGLALGIPAAGSSGLTTAEAQALAACRGSTFFRHKVIFFEIGMNDCDTRALASLMGISGSVSTIAGAIISLTAIGVPVGAAIAIAGALIAIGGQALNLCNRYGRGVIVDNVGWPCRSQ